MRDEIRKLQKEITVIALALCIMLVITGFILALLIELGMRVNADNSWNYEISVENEGDQVPPEPTLSPECDNERCRMIFEVQEWKDGECVWKVVRESGCGTFH